MMIPSQYSTFSEFILYCFSLSRWFSSQNKSVNASKIANYVRKGWKLMTWIWIVHLNAEKVRSLNKLLKYWIAGVTDEFSSETLILRKRLSSLYTKCTQFLSWPSLLFCTCYLGEMKLERAVNWWRTFEWCILNIKKLWSSNNFKKMKSLCKRRVSIWNPDTSKEIVHFVHEVHPVFAVTLSTFSHMLCGWNDDTMPTWNLFRVHFKCFSISWSYSSK